jgi:hypothetical protein
MAVGNASIASVVGNEERRLGVLGDRNLPREAEPAGNLRGGSSNRGRTHALETKGDKACHDRNDCDHDQQFDERESAVPRRGASLKPKMILRQN